MYIDRYCPQCKVDTSEVVGAGEKLKQSKKKCKMASSQSVTGSRDWGKVALIFFSSQLVIIINTG